jgi:dihydroorotate dehydrogenase (fumarate)
MTDLRTQYLGMSLRSPIVASAGPLTSEPARLVELERAGAGAVVLPSLFEEQIEHDTYEIDRLYSLHQDSFGEATSMRPEVGDDVGADDRYLELIAAAKQAVDIPVIASLNGTHIGAWLRYARSIEEAGADAIELNLYSVAADPAVSSWTLESEHSELVSVVAGEVKIPVAVKISPYYSSLASFVTALEQVGAAGVVMFNRFYLPDLDLDTLDVTPKISLSSPDELRLPLRWTGILRDQLSMSIAASTGVHRGEDVVKVVLAGADVAMTTSALLRNGPQHLAVMEEQLVDWMTRHEYASVEEMRGAVSREAAADPSAYERANYIGNLATYTSSFLQNHPLELRRA